MGDPTPDSWHPDSWYPDACHTGLQGSVNPYTRHVLRQSGRPELTALVAAWDAVEALVIRVYRGGSAGPGDETEYRRLQSALRIELGLWRDELTPLWRSATIGGKPAEYDPFDAVLGRASAAAFVADWAAMQTLPAARQALNSLILQSSAEGES